ncbi:type II toxin-antitoxin system VapC family toxin [Magnetospirillum sp. UT-4]|uniref:type II toxin-antitoxin system VapC family toxin n=1 Tax=Magnetospirillum sp. UT-4 TaxID=2681467 RepID=UPI00137D26A3|nr:type II toxin-antitoxin system VapC family toxin [Magnetospirillum sp. UT-4]CAA7612169.1 PilT domain-containing protein [Magnetospirillum sp. UT-4]
MTAFLLDTHAWAWSLSGDGRLSAAALNAIDGADTVLVSPISFFEIAQKVRLGKWPEMEPFAANLGDLLSQQGGTQANFDATVCITAGLMEWSHRDPFDRLLAATARRHNVSLVSADSVFDGVVDRVW